MWARHGGLEASRVRACANFGGPRICGAVSVAWLSSASTPMPSVRAAQVLDKEWPVHHDSIPGVWSTCQAVQVCYNVFVKSLSLKDKSVRLWNPHSGKHIKKFSGCHNQEVNDVLTLDKKRRGSALRTGDVTRKRMKTWSPLRSPVDAARIADDNSKFVSCGSDKLIFQWDEELLLSASHDKTVRIWDLRARGKGPIQDQLQQPIGSISVSSDGECLLASTLDSAMTVPWIAGAGMASVAPAQNIRDHQRLDVESVGSDRFYDSMLSLRTSPGQSDPFIGTPRWLRADLIHWTHQQALQLHDFYTVTYLDQAAATFRSAEASESAERAGSHRLLCCQWFRGPRDSKADGKLHFWELVEATPLVGAQQGHSAAVLCLAFFEETLVPGLGKL
eukprot:Skav214901  [mRNA]  locus=scaffold1561:144656:147560:- [translate_table: standard]